MTRSLSFFLSFFHLFVRSFVWLVGWLVCLAEERVSEQRAFLFWLGGRRSVLHTDTQTHRHAHTHHKGGRVNMQTESVLQKRTHARTVEEDTYFGTDNSSKSIVKDVFEALACESAAFEIFERFDLSGELSALFRGDGLSLVLGQFFQSLCVFAQIDLSANKNDRCNWAVMSQLWHTGGGGDHWRQLAHTQLLLWRSYLCVSVQTSGSHVSFTFS